MLQLIPERQDEHRCTEYRDLRKYALDHGGRNWRPFVQTASRSSSSRTSRFKKDKADFKGFDLWTNDWVNYLLRTSSAGRSSYLY